MAGLGDLAGGLPSSAAYAVSANGSVIVGQGNSLSGAEAVRWAGGSITGLGDLAGGVYNSSAQAVSADGSIVVGYGTNASGAVAMIWDAGSGMRALSDALASAGAPVPSGWVLQRANGLSADGSVIVGTGIDPVGRPQAWIAHLPSCYANCDQSTTAPILNVLDFTCFLNRFAAGDPYANCDASTQSPVLNVLDFGCFLNRFAAGCS
jgi:uncharacterized membrane protein